MISILLQHNMQLPPLTLMTLRSPHHAEAICILGYLEDNSGVL